MLSQLTELSPQTVVETPVVEKVAPSKVVGPKAVQYADAEGTDALQMAA